MLSDIIQTEKYFRLLSHIWCLAEGTYNDGIRNWNNFKHVETEILRSWLTKWEIHNYSTFTSRTKWLLHEGYRTEFKQLSAKLTTFPYCHDLSSNANPTSTNQENAKLCKVMQYQECLSSSGILAYDYITYIAILHMSTTFGYITTEQTIDKSKSIVHMLQDHYHSWDECMIACIAGSHFQGSREYDRNYSIHKEDYIRVLNMLYHPDTSIDWKSKLK